MISVLSLEGRYRILSRVSAGERGTKSHILMRAIKLKLPSLECDNLFITYLCLYQSYSEGAKIRFYLYNYKSFDFISKSM